MSARHQKVPRCGNGVRKKAHSKEQNIPGKSPQKKTTAAKPYFAPIIRSKATAPIKVIAPHLPTTKDKEISPKTLRPQGYSWDKHKKKQTNTL